MDRVLAIICSNGLGHFRRTIAILDRLDRAHPTLAIDVVAEAWQWERSRDWAPAVRLEKKVRRHTGFVEPGVRWFASAEPYEDGRLLGWTKRIAALEEMKRADLVISDNLPGILAVRPDAVLAGSFLWSDVLEAAHPGRDHVRAFVEHERELLERHRPPMLCVGDIAMDGVVARTTAVRLPWMCEQLPWSSGAPRAHPRSRPRIGVFGGATGLADVLLDPVAERLRASGAEVSPGGAASPSYQKLDLVVCRPGCGTVTACIAARVPMVMTHEPNAELAHNARRLEALGIGMYAGENASALEVSALVDRALQPRTYETMSRKMASLASDGLDKAAAWLLDRLARQRVPSGNGR